MNHDHYHTIDVDCIQIYITVSNVLRYIKITNENIFTPLKLNASYELVLP